jgi:endonuclease/exonuclease/phosphatase family metal-dependent hydrolase
VKKYTTGIFSALLIILLLPGTAAYSVKKPAAAEKTQSSFTLKIASFNMQIFGKTKLKRPNTLTVLAEIASNFDIIALQEVGSNKSSTSDRKCESIMNTYVNAINKIAGENLYSYIRGNQYAIVYRTDKVKVNDYSLYAGTENFSYTPLIANFQTIHKESNFDFSIITIHTSPKTAEDEIPALKTVIEETQALYSEPDILCLGDFNADGGYYDEGSEEWLSGFDPETYITGIPNSCDTTVADSDNTYDRIQMTMSLSGDYTGESGVFRFGEFYDITGCEGSRTSAGTERAISDHYPVWCEYYTDRDTD